MDAIVATSTTPDELPIAQARDDIVRLLVKHDFLVVVGDTGDWNRSVCLFYAQSAGRAARAPRTSRRDVASTAAARRFASVSYTHLTLPTKA
mgnify:CR=1 FL=1